MSEDRSQYVVTARSLRGFWEHNHENVAKAVEQETAEAGDPWRAAAMMAALGEAFRQVEAAADEVDEALVLVAPQDRLGSLLQSALAAQAGDDDLGAVLEAGGQETKFDGKDIGWAASLWHMIGRWFSGKHDPRRPATANPDPVGASLSLAMLGDWGTGMYGAKPAAASIEADKRDLSMLWHLGDVYYSGTESEVRDRFLAPWPKRPGAINRALNSNHEMYSGGDAYFDITLPEFQQASSYFAFQNDHWTLVGLDTAYEDHALDDEQAKWLDQVVAQAGNRRIVLFSHHQLYSHLSAQGGKLAARLGQHLAQKKIFAWYWGHEHHCVLYDEHPGYGLHARCIGHGGIPYKRTKAGVEESSGPGYSWRRLQKVPTLPPALVLDGPNPYTGKHANKFGPQGYAILEFDDDHLNEVVCLPDGTEAWNRQLV